MSRVGRIAILHLILLLLYACGVPPQPSGSQPPISTITTSPSVTFTPRVETPTPTRTPEATIPPSPSPVPTFSPPELLAVASTGMDRILATAEGRTLVCLRYEDLNADGIPEWLALTYQQETPSNLRAFILDAKTSYTLEPALPKPGAPDVGFGQYAMCEIDIRDINLDGRPDISIFGHAQNNETLLNIFNWDAANGQYERLGYFTGDAGVMFVEADGDLAYEIWEGYRIHEAPTLTWYVIHTWQDETYGWTSDRFDWYFQERPRGYPTHGPDFAVIAFYLALDDRDLPGAYELLLPQSRASYETWAVGFATTVRIDVGGAHNIPASVSADRARVAAMVTAYDNEGGTIIKRLWNVEWDTVKTEQGWRLLASTAEMLEESKATFFP